MSTAQRCGSRENTSQLFILFCPFPSFHFTLSCQNVATIMTGSKELKRLVNSSLSQSQSPGMWLSLPCPFPFALLLPVQTCLLLSCPVMSCLVLSYPSHSVSSWPWGKAISSLRRTPSLIPASKQKANRMVCAPRCQPIPRRMQTPSANPLLHWMPTPEWVYVFWCTNTYSLPLKTSMCRN